MGTAAKGMLGKSPSPRPSLGKGEGGNHCAAVKGEKGNFLINPLGYLDFLKLMAYARVVLTDSGGIQEETTILKVPCLTLRENTERPITVEMGTNRLVGSDPARILENWREIMRAGNPSASQTPPLWDGHASERIINILLGQPSG